MRACLRLLLQKKETLLFPFVCDSQCALKEISRARPPCHAPRDSECICSANYFSSYQPRATGGGWNRTACLNVGCRNIADYANDTHILWYLFFCTNQHTKKFLVSVGCEAALLPNIKKFASFENHARIHLEHIRMKVLARKSSPNISMSRSGVEPGRLGIIWYTTLSPALRRRSVASAAVAIFMSRSFP